MGAKTTSSVPFSMLPRLGFSPGHKTGSSSRSPYAENPEEDWYIPYNGPLEPPKSVSMAKQDTMRHSVSQDDVNTFLEDSQLLDRYRDTSVNDAGPVGLGLPAQSTGFPRTRVRSDFTRRTTSSTSIIDPIRPHPRRRQASAPRLQSLTHTMDASAGVGESPMPMQRIAMSSPQKKIGRFFGFGSSKKSKRQSISTPVSPISRTHMPGTWFPNSVQHSTLQENVNFAKPSGSSPNTSNHFDSPYVTLPRPSRRSHTLHYLPRVDVVDPSPSKQHSARHVDLHRKPDQDSFPSFPTTNYDSPTILMAHPYANTSSSASMSALRPGTSQQSRQGHQQLDSCSQSSHFSHNNPTLRNRALTYAIDPRSDRAATMVKNARPLRSPLKPSVSTPNLFAASRDKQPLQQSTKSTSPVAGVERWLSPETWCNALFFPRPRLKVKRAHEPHGGSSGRILSPPITPVTEGATPRLSPALLGGRPQMSLVTTDTLKEHHALLKSRSAVDILSGPSISSRPRTAPMQRHPDPIEDINLEESECIPGASTAQQELRPSTPVPSLTQVLEEGEVLEEQRRQWQHQASHSFGNSRTRSLSRARARSLSRSHGHKPEGSTTLEYLAARTLLGGQGIAPTVNVARSSHSRSHSYSHASSNSRGRSSSYSFTRSHSHSLGKSNSQRSLTDPQPQNTRHARNDSWGKTALLKACAPCGDLSDLLGTPVESKKPALEPMTEETKIIHLSDPADAPHNEADEGRVIVIGVSPAPTIPSGEGVGIALSSPPPSDNRFCLDPGLPSMPSHPYATGAIYTRYLSPSSEHGLQHDLKVSDYAGPHPSAYDPQLPSNTATSDVSMRHRLPPRAMQPGVISHPYAAALSEPVNSHARQPSNSVLPTLPVPPSVVQEDNGFTSGNHISISSPDFEKYGVGEALVFAAPSQDEQETDSEDQSFGTIIPCQQDTLSRIIDKGKVKDSTSAPTAFNNNRSQISGSDSAVVSTRPPSLISVTPVEGRDSSHSPGARPTTNITSAHLVISALDNDDLDEFQDLFYRPPQSRLSSGKSSVKHQDASEISKGIPSDIHSSYSGSALTNLMRSMSEIGELHVAASDFSHGQRSGGPGDQRSDELSQTYVFMDMSRTPSPAQVDPCAVTQSPVQLYEAPFEASVPEDIESSRVSSPLIASQENDTFGHPIRQDVVDAAGKSTIHQGSRRTSTYASIHDAAEEADLVSPISFIQSPPFSADAMRSSYMTSGSEYSRMSTLSDFPDPPAQPNITPNQPSILQIYVDAPTPLQQSGGFEGTNCPQSGSRVFSLDSHHTTFGGSDDMDIITRVHRSEF
ncbi:uncharacterized protein BJ212DRAFT_1326768 [Suillus subaureus]|uniref:Uncharacterized protein n=1 Tax=Suillus subaureus TaxID=48587 RepID=A0A9P7JIE3_9AGAM|nr:uncharacterized protein BJ212DRAFT_1326768 [Suillus subaureus]KAG1823801.1 hypothetical protein BJ212DRAFT_1326768 [Suillus subaureus]